MRLPYLLLLTTLSLAAQNQELGLLLGNLRGIDSPKLGSGTALQANYAIRLASAGPLKVFGGVNFLANPQRKVTSANPVVIRDVATIYLTPELKVKLGERRLQPYAFLGAGLAVYEHSNLTTGGSPNPGPRTTNTGTFTYGGGADVRVIRWFALRGELRDNYSGAPVYNIPAGKQHNVSITGGFVLRWGH
ncbi:MAG: hypothetical protein HYX27_26290 [Acidobacteria bacterium]|nr:hypothetical protein [Acidobacteriota bacterium]